MKWATWFEDFTNRRVANDTFEVNGERVRVSTVFLALDHAFNESSPILWETMVFGGKHDEEQDRCGGNREQAETMHAAMVAKAKAA